MALALSILGTIIGFAVLCLVSIRKARDKHEFRLLRMLGLLVGCLLVSAPLVLGAWRTRAQEGRLSALFALAALALTCYAPTLVLLIIKKVTGDAKQFRKDIV